MPVPYTFANQIGNIALSELDANFANVKAATDTAATVTASAQPAITSVGQLTSLGVLGNISTLLGGVYSPGFYYPNGVSILTGISSSSSSYGNANVAAYLPGYDGGLISLTGNITTTADVNAAKGVFSSTLTTSGNITTSANIYASRDITGQTLTSQGAITGTTITATSGNITATGGNVVASNFTTSGNVVSSQRVQANSIWATNTVQGSDLYSTGVIRGAYGTFSGNITVDTYANVGVDVNATGNVSATYFIGNGSLLTGIVASGNAVSSVAASAITGNVLSSNVTASYLTSVGTLSALTVGGTLTATGSTVLQAVSATTGTFTGAVNGTTFTGTGLIRGASLQSNSSITGGSLTISGTMTGNGATLNNILASDTRRNVTVSSSAPTSGQGSVGDIWFQTY